MTVETINQRIARIRKAKGLKQRDMAERLNMKESTYSQMERQGNISAQTLLDIAAVLEVDINVLLYGEDNIPAQAERNDNVTFAQKPIEFKFEDTEKPKPITKFDVAVEAFRNFNREQQARVYDLIQEILNENK